MRKFDPEEPPFEMFNALKTIINEHALDHPHPREGTYMSALVLVSGLSSAILNIVDEYFSHRDNQNNLDEIIEIIESIIDDCTEHHINVIGLSG